jgi:hypothetical protein
LIATIFIEGNVVGDNKGYGIFFSRNTSEYLMTASRRSLRLRFTFDTFDTYT